jgi:hypothetical protein
MSPIFSASEGNETNLNRDYKNNVILFELSSFEMGAKISNLINELNSRGLMYSIWIAKKKQYLIVYNFDQVSTNKEKLEKMLKHLTSTYSLRIEENTDNFFISDIQKIEQDDKFLTFTHSDKSKQYVLACQLVSLDLEADTIAKRFTQFTKDLVEAEAFSVNISQFVSREKNQRNVPSLGILFIARSHDKNSIEGKKAILLRYLKATAVKLNGQLLFISKRDIVKHKTNFQFFVPWIKHTGFIKDLLNINRLFPPFRIEVPHASKNEIIEQRKESVKQIQIPEQKPNKVVSLPFPNSKKPYQSIRSKNLETPKIISSEPIPENGVEKYAPSRIDDLSVPVPRTMNSVFDAEYLKVRISKIFKEFEFKESLIFEENFDLVLRKGSSYVFVKFFKDIMTQDYTYKIIENLSSIAGLRNQFLCIAVADVIDDISKKLLNEYNILHLTVTDVLVKDKLKAKIYGTILA